MSETVSTTFTSDSRQVERDLERMQKKYVDLERKMADMKTASQQVGKAHGDAFGDSTLTKIAATAAGYVSLTRVTQGYVDLLAKANDLERQAGDRARASAAGMAQLAQLAESPHELRLLTNRAKAMFEAGGAPTLDAAARNVFALASAGMGNQQEFFTNLQSSGLVGDAGQVINSIAALQQALGADKTGNAQALFSMALGAGKISTKGTAEQMLEAGALAGGTARSLGIDVRELLAAEAVVSNIAGVEEGATAVAQLLRTLDEKSFTPEEREKARRGEKIPQAEQIDFHGMTLPEAIQAIQGLGMERGELMTWMGRIEGMRALDALVNNFDTFNRSIQEVTTAERENRVLSKLGFMETDPLLATDRAARILRARGEMQQESAGITNLAANALEEEINQQIRGEVGDRSFTGWSRRQMLWLRRYVAGDEGFLEGFGGLAESPETREILKRRNIDTTEGDRKRQAARQLEARFAPLPEAGDFDLIRPSNDPRRFLFDPTAPETEQLLELQRRNNELLRQMNDNLKPKRNLNAHVE